ncbi:MAG: ABC transporter ATP-binding protein/permease [Gammaproteobacteria bacterium]|nr:ABC transporter ATP-binding protein/permease [Gammaproteobacteria bacterium]
MISRAQARVSEPHKKRTDWANLRRLLPYLWAYRGRILLALACLILAKVATVAVPLVLKQIVDQFDVDDVMLKLPLALLLTYGALRLSTALFSELRDVLFARARFHAVRSMSADVLAHLHRLSMRFHLDRRTGSISRDLERGTQSLSSLSNYFIFIVIPTVFEITLVMAILFSSYAIHFAVITLGTVMFYILFTALVTNWRMHYRHTANQLDSEAHSQAVDSLMNYETVKYFNNEEYEVKRYASTLSRWEHALVKSTVTMSLLNFGQASIIAIGVTLIMMFAADGVVRGEMTIGDLVLVNALMLQLFVPMNMLGIVYRQITYALADMDLLTRLLNEKPEVKDKQGAQQLDVQQGAVEFEHVAFSYNPDRVILRDISMRIPSGQKIAVVGPSGAGKSTIARLLFRFYETTGGRVLIDGQDIAAATQDSLRQQIGMVPQETVLFNNSIRFNIEYARPGATEAEIQEAIQIAQLDNLITQLPEGMDTVVGERGLKLSGGELQRVAIARAILKKPKILIFDEATSSLDSDTEVALMKSIRAAASGVTSLIIAHRLSTIVDADCIYVLEAGCVVEQGSHAQLLAKAGLYSRLWNLQQSKQEHKES